MKRHGLWLCAVILSGALSYGVSRLTLDNATPASETDAHAAELRALRSQVRELQASVESSTRVAHEAHLTAQAARAANPRPDAPAAPAAPSVPADPDESEPDTESAAERRQEMTSEEAVTRLDARFFGEGVDRTWSHEATQRAERLRTHLPQGARFLSMECRSSMCRLEMVHANLEAFQHFIRDGLINDATSWDGPFMAALKSPPGRPGEVEAVAYLARPGADLAP